VRAMANQCKMKKEFTDTQLEKEVNYEKEEEEPAGGHANQPVRGATRKKRRNNQMD